MTSTSPSRPTRITAIRLCEGDTIIAEGRIPIRVTGLRPAICGLVAAAYECAAGTGTRVYPAGQHLDVIHAETESVH